VPPHQQQDDDRHGEHDLGFRPEREREQGHAARFAPIGRLARPDQDPRADDEHGEYGIGLTPHGRDEEDGRVQEDRGGRDRPHGDAPRDVCGSDPFGQHHHEPREEQVGCDRRQLDERDGHAAAEQLRQQADDPQDVEVTGRVVDEESVGLTERIEVPRTLVGERSGPRSEGVHVERESTAAHEHDADREAGDEQRADRAGREEPRDQTVTEDRTSGSTRVRVGGGRREGGSRGHRLWTLPAETAERRVVANDM
jgi:hypothetical protein